MRLDRQTILELDDSQFSAAEKEFLLKKFFPPQPSPFNELGQLWSDKKRWDHLLSHGRGSCNPFRQPYRYSHQDILRAARLSSDIPSGNAVTSFTGWIFSLYKPSPTRLQLEKGKMVERAIARKFARSPENKGWDLVFKDPLNEHASPKKISSLLVNGVPLRGIPDLVFREKATGRILIIERKASNRTIPIDGWPNLKAQLWAYGMVDDWIEAKDVVLPAEIWGFDSSGPYLRETLRWARSDPEFQHDNRELFAAYGGTMIPLPA